MKKIIQTLMKEIHQIESTPKKLREFGVVMGIFFAILAAVYWWRQRELHFVFGLLTGAFFLLGFFIPNTLKPLQKLWMTLAVCMGFVMSRVLLAILFYFTVTPIGFLARLFGKKFLEDGFDKSKDSYWKNHAPQTKDSCQRQF